MNNYIYSARKVLDKKGSKVQISAVREGSKEYIIIEQFLLVE